MSSGKWQPSCLGLKVLIIQTSIDKQSPYSIAIGNLMIIEANTHIGKSLVDNMPGKYTYLHHIIHCKL